MSVRFRYAVGVFWSIAASIAAQGSTLLCGLIVSNSLGKVAFGSYSLIQTTIVTIAGAAALATGITSTRFVAEFREGQPGSAGRVIAICLAVSAVSGLLGALGVCLASERLDLLLSVEHRALNLFLLAGASLGFAVVLVPIAGSLIGLEAYSDLARLRLVAAVGSVSAVTAGVHWLGLGGAVGGVLIANTIGLIFGFYVLRRVVLRAHIPLSLVDARREQRLVANFALPSAASGLATLPTYWVGNAVLAKSLAGPDELAYFAAANGARSLVLFLPSIVNGVAGAILQSKLGVLDRGTYNRLFGANLALTLAITILCAGVLIAVPSLWLGMYGEDYGNGASSLRLLMCAAIFETICVSVFHRIQSEKAMWTSLFYIVLPREALFLSFSLGIVPKFGAFGLSASVALASVISFVLHLIVLRRLIAKRAKERDDTGSWVRK